MRVGIYIRVSSVEQAEEGYSVGAQEEKLKAYCKARSWDIYNIYIDPGYTGSNVNRPAMQKLIKDIKARKIDILLVYKLDRFTRSQKDCINLLEDLLLPNNVDFVSLNENFDTSTPYGRAMIGILSVFAQLERETIRERTIMGRIERAKTGLYSGNANLPIGYDYIDGKLVINDYEAMQVREIFNLYNKGSSIAKILNTFQIKGYTTKHGEYKHLNTIKRILASKLYYGDLKYKGNYYEGQHKPIITKTTYDKAQSIHKNYTETATGHRKTPFMSTHLLTGFLWCGECGARMHGKTFSRNDYPTYVCYSVSKTSKKYTVDPNCKATTWPCWELEEIVLESIKDLNPEKINVLKNENKETQDYDNEFVIKKQIDDINKKLQKLVDLYLMDSLSKEQIETKSKHLDAQKQSLEKQLKLLNATSKKATTREIMRKVNAFDEVMNTGDLKRKKALLSSLIDKIEVSKDSIKIRWTFI